MIPLPASCPLLSSGVVDRDHFDDYLAYRMFANGVPCATPLDQPVIEHVDARVSKTPATIPRWPIRTLDPSMKTAEVCTEVFLKV
ncbi:MULTISPECIES: hypothetical protein [unclassified Methanoculleus]|jgi:hypothetical protein|uniref:Uncharacterized protein n=1 Tax=Methanoculleus palmolei TaxID=72612 RepID=A0ABD8ABH8_9EURY|nr:hypothetical protein [Methanoculleus sp. UBA377]WOX56570.1 hypothetical protein R6Y95_04345 [Methanoculleus palmolei]